MRQVPTENSWPLSNVDLPALTESRTSRRHHNHKHYPTHNAKAGDSLNLEFTVNKTIASGNVSILESRLNATSIIDGYDFKATVIVPSTQREEYANFTVQVTDTTGKNVSITEDDLPSNVFVDTIRPRIKLDGNASYSISLNATNPFIPNVIITDGDPNYSMYLLH